MKSATTASTEMPQPAIAMPGLAGRDELGRDPARPRLAVELERDGHLPDRAVGADGEHDLPGQLEVAAARDVEPFGRAAQVGQRRARCRSERRQLGVVADELVQPVLDADPVLDAVPQHLPPGGREAAALGGDPDERDGRAQRERRRDVGDDRIPLLGLPRPGRVEDPDDVLAAVAEDAAHRLAVVRIAGEALGQDEQARG